MKNKFFEINSSISSSIIVLEFIHTITLTDKEIAISYTGHNDVYNFETAEDAKRIYNQILEALKCT